MKLLMSLSEEKRQQYIYKLAVLVKEYYRLPLDVSYDSYLYDAVTGYITEGGHSMQRSILPTEYYTPGSKIPYKHLLAIIKPHE